jgi:hypothetical protein
MGWYDSAWSHRWAITVVNSAPAASGDVEIVVPADWGGWDVIQADGDDIRITTADGQTLASYALSGFNYANRTVTLQVDGVTLSNVAGMDLLWVYAGNASAASAAVAVTISGALAGYIETGRPSTLILEAQPEQPGTTRPRKRVQKTANEQLYLWIRIDKLLERKAAPYEGRTQHEELRSAVVSVTLAGSAQGGMVDTSKQRFLERRGRYGREMWVKAFIQAGTTANDYTIVTALRTVVPTNTAYRLIEPRAFLAVESVSEA